MHRIRRRVSGLAISARLAALVLVPLLGMTAFGTAQALDAYEEAAAARTMRDQAQLVALLSISSAHLEQELDSLNGIVEAQAFGFDFELVSTALGYDFLSSLSISQADTDAGLAALASVDPSNWAAPDAVAEVVAFADDLAQIRSDSVEGRIDRADVNRITAELRDAMSRAIDAQTGRLGDARDQVAVSTELSALLDAAERAERVASAAREDRRALSSYLLPALDTEEMTEQQRRDLLVRSAHDFDRHLDALLQVDVPAITHHLEQDLAGPDLVDFEELRQEALTRRTVPFETYDDFAALSNVGLVLFVRGFARIDHFASLNVESATLVTEQTSALGEAAAADFVMSVVIATVLAVGTALLGFVILRSIVLPLRALERRASAITEGDLEPPASATGGPRDLRSIDEAMDRMTTDLTTLSRQTEALAAGRLDDEVLEETVVGPIGASVHGSLNRLLRMTARLEHEATHDRLTGLPNRAALLQLLDRCLTGAVEQRVAVGAAMFDLDGFKQANDVLGHPIGDEILVAVARRFEAVAGAAFVARLGGDEFMVVVVADGTGELGDDPVDLAERLVAALDAPIATSSGPVPISAGAGVVVASDDDWLAPTEVLRRVDLALYEAKSQGSGEVVEFDQALHDSLLHSARIQGEIRRALANDEFELHLQAVVDADTHQVGGFEALLRWHPPEGEPISPGIFIPVAEQTDLIIDIDRWVLARGAELLGRWADDPAMAHFSLSINISGRHVSSPELVTAVAAEIDRHGFDPSRLVIEVTESQIIPSLDRAERVLRQLAELGVKLAIDDFGTGYASVAHLRHIRFDRLKIDRTFLLALEDETERALANLLVSLGRDLRLEVVAEGVETQQQVDWASEAGCTHLQGYRFSKPAPVETAVALAVAGLVPATS